MNVERLAPWVAGALIALPVLFCHYPPAADVPLHEAVVGLLRHWGDPRYVPEGVYQLNFGQANQLFYFLILPLAYVFPIGVASKIVLAATVFFFPVAVGRLADHLGVTRLAALLLAPVGFGYMFFWGLLANMVGVDLYLLALPTLDRFCQRPTKRRLAVVCGWMVLLHFAHGLVALTAAGTLVVFVVASWKKWEPNVIRLFPIFIALVLTASSLVLAEWSPVKTHAAYTGASWVPVEDKIETFVGALYSELVVASWVRYAVFAACQIPLVFFACERWLARPRPAPRRTVREWLFAYRFELLAAALLLCYFAGPGRAGPHTRIYQRFLTPAWVLVTLSLCPRVPRERPLWFPTVLAPLAPIVAVLLALPRFAESDRIYGGLDAVLAHMDPGSAAIAVHIGASGPYSFECGGANGHVVGVLGGRSYYDYTLMEGAPVNMRAEAQWDTTYTRIGWISGNWIPDLDMTRYRYFLVHAPDTGLLDVVLRALQPEGKLAFREGEWMVVESLLPLVPPRTPDEAPPNHALMTLQRRLEILSAGGGPAPPPVPAGDGGGAK